MSYKLHVLLSGFFAFSSFSSGYASDETPAVPFESFTGKITGAKVRIRTQPHLEGYVVREANYNEMFVVTNQDTDFYTISPPKGMKGYVFRTFVLDSIVEGERVNIRLYPDIEAPVIGKLNTGDKVNAIVCENNNKWLEIELPQTCYFYVAKDYVEKKGGPEFLAQYEKKQNEASHKLSATFLYGAAELQKSFEHVDIDALSRKFENLITEYEDLYEISEKAKEGLTLFQDIYVQKKIAFLESKTEKGEKSLVLDPSMQERLAKLGIDPKLFLERPSKENRSLEMIGALTATTVGLSSPLSDEEITDKMMAWEPLEEAIYHLWAAVNGEKGIDAFYAEERESALTVSGMVEPYSKPVKNCPGDYLLKNGNLPVAFLYSTKVNLQKFAGKKVTFVVSPRPNNHFAFPAYHVLAVE